MRREGRQRLSGASVPAGYGCQSTALRCSPGLALGTLASALDCYQLRQELLLLWVLLSLAALRTLLPFSCERRVCAAAVAVRPQ